MKRRNGFTLIELLAVIVILAVIALIAVPRIIEILNKSRLSAAEDSIYGIVEAAESYIANFILQNQGAIPSEDLKFSCNIEGCNLTNELNDYNTENLKILEFKGKKPTDGVITISDNGNKVTVYGLLINNFICNYGDGDADCIDVGDIGATQEAPPSTQHEGVKAIVYLDPTDFTNKCTSDDVNSDTGTKTGCMKWYAYDEDDSTYTMILDHNTTDVVAWNSNGTNSEMKEIKTQLESDTKNWDKSLQSRLITADEVAKITNNDKFDSKNASTWFLFFDLTTNRQTGAGDKCRDLPEGCHYAWLYDRTRNTCKEDYGCLNDATGTHIGYGYWTSTPVYSGNYEVWRVAKEGELGYASYANYTNIYGVRPVITVSKSLVKN